MRVLIPSPLRSYTGQSWVEASGATLGAVLADLERQYPGVRFRMIDEQDRMRPNMRFFVNGAATFELAQPLRATDEVQIVQALSGG
ncbi:MAG: MoaD/ThiS family protein [Burkholderiaceae bacterium]